MPYEIPEHLKLGRVLPFTKSPLFNALLDRLFQDLKERIENSGQIYASDYSAVGLPGLANGCVRKSLRIFDYYVLDKVGKDNIEDELLDNLEIAVYTVLYHRMLESENSELFRS